MAERMLDDGARARCCITCDVQWFSEDGECFHCQEPGVLLAETGRST